MSEDPAPKTDPAADPPTETATREDERQAGATSFGQFLGMLEDGALGADLTEALLDINTAMTDHVRNYGGKAKAKLTITVDFLLLKDIFEITAKYAVKTPEAARGRTISWPTPGGLFSPENPSQLKLWDKPRPVINV